MSIRTNNKMQISPLCGSQGALCPAKPHCISALACMRPSVRVSDARAQVRRRASVHLLRMGARARALITLGLWRTKLPTTRPAARDLGQEAEQYEAR